MRAIPGLLHVLVGAVVLPPLVACGRTGLSLSLGHADGAGGAPTRSTSSTGGTTSDASGSTGSLSEQQVSIIDACVIAASCGEAYPFVSASKCIDGFGLLWWYAEGYAAPNPTIAAHLLQCAGVAHGDCAAFRSCFGGNDIALSGEYLDGTCQGQVAQQGNNLSFDCAAIGATCQSLVSTAGAVCNHASCAGPTSVTCNGSIASHCSFGGQFLEVDCAKSGRVCADGAPPGAWPCVGTSDACMPGGTSCVGDTASYCAGGKLATFDCQGTLFRTACSPSSLATEADPPCKYKADTCLPAADSCSGTSIQLCVDGDFVDVDCKALGFTGCSPTTTGAACTP